MKVKKIILIRHAESEANAGGIFEHSHIVKITEKGKRQAEDLVEVILEKLDKPDRIIVSKFIRTIETAEPTIRKFPDTETHLWLETHEFSYLDKKNLAELTVEKLRERAQGYWEQNDPFHKDGLNQESFGEFTERVNSLILKMKKLDGVNFMFSHGLVIRLLKILFTEYRGVFEKQKIEQGEVTFYKNLMSKFYVHLMEKEINEVKNTEILDFTKEVENY